MHYDGNFSESHSYNEYNRGYWDGYESGRAMAQAQEDQSQALRERIAQLEQDAAAWQARARIAEGQVDTMIERGGNPFS